jgi:hypothetical protein
MPDQRCLSTHQRGHFWYQETLLSSQELKVFSDEPGLLFLQGSRPWGEEHFQIVGVPVGRSFDSAFEREGNATPQICLTGGTGRELRDTSNQRERGLAMTTLIEEADFMLNASRQHKEPPE